MKESPIKLYTVQETADVLGVHFRTVYKYIDKKELKAIKLNGQWRIKEEDIRNYLDRLETNIKWLNINKKTPK